MWKVVSFALFLASAANGQVYKACVLNSYTRECNSLQLGDSQVSCQTVDSIIDCAIQLSSNAVDFGVFSEEEVLLLAQQSSDYRVVASIRDVSRLEPYAFEAVAIVPRSLQGGLQGLRSGNYCHPGLDHADARWSPRVLKAFEEAVLGTSSCPDTNGRTPDELAVQRVSEFFGNACRPGPWSVNDTLDATLKSRYPNLCSRCGANSACSSYTIDMGVSVAGADNNNRHIQALECMRTGGASSVAYVAWQHAREYFQNRNVNDMPNYAVLCPNGTLVALDTSVVGAAQAPCSFVKQPWRAIVARTSQAEALQASIRTWWPNGLNAATTSQWQSTLFSLLIGGSGPQVVIEDARPTPANYTSAIRQIPSIDASSSCFPARRWCTISSLEHTKCTWVRAAAWSLGLQPSISCQQRPDVFQCLQDISEDQADFIVTQANYGYLARHRYRLSPVKLVQTARSEQTRVAAFVKDSSVASQNITRFENLRDKRACFPEYGGIAYVAFVRAAQLRSVISPSECNYARAVSEFFTAACAPGALADTHSLSDSSFNATNLCTVCQPAVTAGSTVSNSFTCAYDFSNLYYGNNGSLNCLTDPTTHVAFLQVANISSYLTALNLNANQFRALCVNNTLAQTAGVNIDDGCLLTQVVDSEIVTRRGSSLHNALAVLLEDLDKYFGYNAALGSQLLNLEIYSQLNGVPDLLFRNSAIGLSEPSSTADNDAARNYVELFQHLEECTGAAAGLAANTWCSLTMALLMAMVTKLLV